MSQTMKELKDLIEAAKTYKKSCMEHTNIDEGYVMPVCLKLEQLESAISAAEAAIKRAKVSMSIEVDSFNPDHLDRLPLMMAHAGPLNSMSGQSVTIIVIPKEE